MAMITIATVAVTARAATNPGNAARTIQSAVLIVQHVALGTFNLVKGLCYRERNTVLTGVQNLGQAALASVDTVVYAVATITPIMPIGAVWTGLRR